MGDGSKSLMKSVVSVLQEVSGSQLSGLHGRKQLRGPVSTLLAEALTSHLIKVHI